MTWIKDEINRRKRQKDLGKYAEELCDAVWKEIVERATEAAGEGMPVIVHGEQIVLKGNPPKTLTVDVGMDGRSVEANNGITLRLGLNGESPCLVKADGGRALSVEEAARLILEPFLFTA